MSAAHAPSSAYPLTERILDVLEENGATSVEGLPRYIAGADRVDIDTALNKLMRESRVSRAFGKYDLVPGQKPRAATGERSGFVSVATPGAATAPKSAPPTAADEASKSLQPETERRCKGRCLQVKPIDDFSKIATCTGGRDPMCKACRQALRTAAKKSAAPGSQPAAPLPNSGPQPPLAGPGKPAGSTAGTPTIVRVDAVRENAVARHVALTAQITAAREELDQIEQFLQLYDRFMGASS